MSKYFGYIRVSTLRQGERGVSLQEQRDAISRYASREGLDIIEWFEERLTAAKLGRPGFTQMLQGLKNGRAGGVIMHKIDRSARNLRDWTNLGDLIDQGVDVRFAHDSVDLHSRGGRLSADIQAVVAADYVRNLREETRKGFYGRLKQGLFPLAAPVGYVDNGKGQPKTICPKNGPLIKQLFEFYATGRFSLATLSDEMFQRGLRSRNGRRVPHSMIGIILANPFYTGTIRIINTGEVFPGIHQPLISRSLFDAVRAVAEGRVPKRPRTHRFLFRQTFRCANCQNRLIGERQKGHVYYRCHTRYCRQTSVREESLEAAIQTLFMRITLNDDEHEVLKAEAQTMEAEQAVSASELVESHRLQVAAQAARLDRLTDAFLEGDIDKAAYQSRQESYLAEQQRLKEALRESERNFEANRDQLGEFLELAKGLSLLYQLGNDDEKRDIVQTVVSNLTAHGKEVAVTPYFPFQLIAERPSNLESALERYTTRTFLTQLLETLTQGPQTWRQFKRGGVENKEG